MARHVLSNDVFSRVSHELNARNLKDIEETASNSAAKTERSLRRVWIKCTEAEETNRKLKKLKLAKVGTNAIEAYSRSKAGRDKWVNRG